jgi:hypothetical protein
MDVPSTEKIDPSPICDRLRAIRLPEILAAAKARRLLHGRVKLEVTICDLKFLSP